MFRRNSFVLCLLAVLFACGFADVLHAPLTYYARFELTDGQLVLDESFDLTLTVQTFQDLPGTTIQLLLPDGVVLSGSQDQIVVDVARGDTTVVVYDLHVERPGAFRVDALISPPTPDAHHWPVGASYYIHVWEHGASHSDEPTNGRVYNQEYVERPVEGMDGVATLQVRG
jgi:hypothetical protein